MTLRVMGLLLGQGSQGSLSEPIWVKVGAWIPCGEETESNDRVRDEKMTLR